MLRDLYIERILLVESLDSTPQRLVDADDSDHQLVTITMCGLDSHKRKREDAIEDEAEVARGVSEA